MDNLHGPEIRRALRRPSPPHLSAAVLIGLSFHSKQLGLCNSQPVCLPLLESLPHNKQISHISLRALRAIDLNSEGSPNPYRACLSGPGCLSEFSLYIPLHAQVYLDALAYCYPEMQGLGLGPAIECVIKVTVLCSLHWELTTHLPVRVSLSQV